MPEPDGADLRPDGALLPELFPTEVRYTGASFSYNVASILGASVAPYIATWLQANYGLFYVGVYLAAMAALTLIALLLTHETKHQLCNSLRPNALTPALSHREREKGSTSSSATK